jgi:hypothetical protein
LEDSGDGNHGGNTAVVIAKRHHAKCSSQFITFIPL